jgi:hypothetical protein
MNQGSSASTAQNRGMLLTFLWRSARDYGMKLSRKDRLRPDIVAAIRGGDTSQAMDDEGDPNSASMEQALYWRQIYREILAMEEKVMERIQDLMSRQSPEARREVELTNVPVVAAQAERFRQRLGFWTARVVELELPSIA